MKNYSLVGRVLFGLPLLFFSFGHFTNAEKMASMVPLPGGIFWVYLTGIALALASISIVTTFKVRLATLLLGIMFLIFAFSIHLPSVLNGNEMSIASMMKDISLAGAAFFFSANSKAGF